MRPQSYLEFRSSATLEERVAYLEGKMSWPLPMGNELRGDMQRRGQKFDNYRDDLSDRIHALERAINRETDTIEQ